MNVESKLRAFTGRLPRSKSILTPGLYISFSDPRKLREVSNWAFAQRGQAPWQPTTRTSQACVMFVLRADLCDIAILETRRTCRGQDLSTLCYIVTCRVAKLPR